MVARDTYPQGMETMRARVEDVIQDYSQELALRLCYGLISEARSPRGGPDLNE